MIRFEGFKDIPATPQAWAGYALGRQMKMFRSVAALTAEAPQRQLHLTQALLKMQQEWISGLPGSLSTVTKAVSALSCNTVLQTGFSDRGRAVPDCACRCHRTRRQKTEGEKSRCAAQGPRPQERKRDEIWRAKGCSGGKNILRQRRCISHRRCRKARACQIRACAISKARRPKARCGQTCAKGGSLRCDEHEVGVFVKAESAGRRAG